MRTMGRTLVFRQGALPEGPEQVGGLQPPGHVQLHYIHEGIAGLGYHTELLEPGPGGSAVDASDGSSCILGEVVTCPVVDGGAELHDTVADPESVHGRLHE